uniref:Uncharacterized protein n=1 Tax=Cacopsylla melanoneura TaxID=428564 RepID=A0A8D8YHN9_9HEMI
MILVEKQLLFVKETHWLRHIHQHQIKRDLRSLRSCHMIAKPIKHQSNRYSTWIVPLIQTFFNMKFVVLRKNCSLLLRAKNLKELVRNVLTQFQCIIFRM